MKKRIDKLDYYILLKLSGSVSLTVLVSDNQAELERQQEPESSSKYFEEKNLHCKNKSLNC